ncbi:MAG: DUF2752 domain-containing protein [Lachnospiraceae bacterium]|nr:DUF2752 domain-containing protein [Lachnospiraceae bacterium]
MRKAMSSVKEDLKRVAPAFIPVVLYCALTQFLFDRMCPFSIITGFPCPACGMTRTVACLAAGRWHEAVLYNIMAVPWVILGIAALVTRYFLPAGKKMMEISLCLVCIATVAYYVFRIIHFYPSEPVMIYNEDNLMELAARRFGI